MPGPSPPELIGQSATWLESLERVSLAALVERPILVIGERGTGKELIAERLHYLSPRWDKPFVKVNCGALSDDLLDSELFGHEQGAFTGATKRRQGRFEQADGGTLFLDEIATASMEVQEKLLRVVEYGEFQRLGGEDTLTCDVRIVAATNVDLPARAADGRFRADLLDRLAFDVITLAPLRARPEDIILLAEHFGQRIARELEGDFPGWSKEALDAMCKHAWPGNVRELRNTAERATFRTMAAQANGAPLGPVSITPDLLDPFNSPWRPPKDLSEPLPSPARVASPRADVLEAESLPVPDANAGPVDFNESVAALEKKLIESALAHCRGHQKKAAERLGLSYHQMRGLLRKYGYGREAGAEDASTPEGASAKPG
ncbi:MAG TPA: phage shock protein operon transcriptional activator [Hyphomonadaceae bacterium]